MQNWFRVHEGWLLGADPTPQSGLLGLMLPIVMIGFLFYFLIIRPEKRKQSAIAMMQDSLKKNDRVVTIGGIIGVVVNAPKGVPEVTLRVDDSNNTRIHVLRSSISRVLGDEKSAPDQPET